ncbi:MAG: NYN domain-containing protein [Aeoliella sp.]
MRILIDGYNLLHATDLFGAGASAGTLQGSREALLAFLAAALSAGERRATTIVFDAAGAPPGLPKSTHHDHLTVRYARGYADADTLLEEIIENHRAPRGLTVVSSDHRVQRAARRRGAKYVDSEHWYVDRVRARRAAYSRDEAEAKSAGKGGGSIAYWVKQFDTPEVADLNEPTPRSDRRDDPDLSNPFPPGYGDDLLGEDAIR